VAEEPDRLRQDIETTRAALTRDVDRLAEKTSPKQVVRRRWTTVKERVMGSTGQARDTVGHGTSAAVGTVHEKASQLGDAAGNTAHEAAEAVRGAPQAVAGQTRGNPLAAGVIAFGVGLLAATLLPVTDAERRAGQELKEHSDQLTDRVKDVAGELRDDVGGTVQEAAGRLKESAQDAARGTGEQVRSSAQDVRDQTAQAARAGGS